MNLKAIVVPWQLKIAAKLVLSRVPAGYSFWRRLALFQHGYMEEPAYAYGVFRRHYDRVDYPTHNAGFVAMEVGPGDSLFSAMIAHAFGAAASYLVDVGTFARPDIEPYRAMNRFLLNNGLPSPDISTCNSLQDVLTVCNARYMTAGTSSLRSLPDRSIDFVWSQAVLEHIRRAEFFDFMREVRRVVRDSAVCSHRVDLMDHLGGALNNLRFPERLWESSFMANSGFYTNRLRYSEMLNLFEDAGFKAEVVQVDHWDKLPTPRVKLSKAFRHLPDDELRVRGFDVLLRPT